MDSIMKKWIIAGSVVFLCVCSGCWLTDDCGPNGSGCHDGIHVWCENGDYENPLEYDCTQEGLSCAQIESGDYACVVPCRSDEVGFYLDGECETADTLGGFFCRENSHYLMINSGEHYFYQYEQRLCEHGCSFGECITIHPDEYQRCDAQYGSSCAGTVMGFCRDGHVQAYECDPNFNGEWTCAIDNGEAVCAETCDPRYFKPTYSCETRDDKAYSVKRSCAFDDEVYFVQPTEELCEHGCSEQTGRCKLHPDEGKTCTESPKSCAGDVWLYCGTDRVIHAALCSEVYASYEGEWACANITKDGQSFASCRQTCPASDANKTKRICGYRASSGTNYSSETSCIASNVNYIETAEIDCIHGCDGNTGECIKLVPEEGNVCNYGDKEICKNDLRVFCAPDKTIHVEDCKANHETCLEHDAKYADCVDSNNCDAVTMGTTRAACLSDYLAGEEKCGLSGTQYAWLQSTDSDVEFCEHGCDSDTGTCKFIHKDEHKACSAAGDLPRCDGKFLLQCNDKQLTFATDCSVSGQACATVDGETACYQKCSADEVGQTVEMCGEFNTLVTYRCTQSGEDYFLKKVSHRTCANGCLAAQNACKKIDPLEDTACTADTFPAQCSEGNAHLLTCVSSYVQAKDCSASDGVCLASGSGALACRRLCTAEDVGKTTGTCMTDAAFLGSECIQDGSLYYYDDAKITVCENGCDEAKPGCK